MSDSFQNELPKSRVKITLDVDKNGASRSQELPMKLLMLGDFSNGHNDKTVAERERVAINKHNFDKVMATLAPKAKLSVANKLDDKDQAMDIELPFNAREDFSPDKIAQNIPELKKLLAMRNLLKDLKANVLDNRSFRQALENILKNKSTSESLMEEIKRLAPINQK